MNNPHHNQFSRSLSLKSLRTKFALRFIRALKQIHHQEKISGGVDYFVGPNNYHQKKCYKVKVAADASMAAAVGPSRAWSRALSSRVRLSWRHVKSKRESIVTCRTKKRPHHRAQMARVQAQGQAEELRSLVPGGEAMELQNLLDETAHYIKCLTTQVKVMRSIVNYCSTS